MSGCKEDVQADDAQCLLEHFMRSSYKAKDNDPKADAVLNNCLKLFSKDYKFSLVNNSNGEICGHYPSKIVVLEYQLTSSDRASNDSVESLYDAIKLKDLFNKARFARCRGRFVVPVILYEGKHICRSSTISGGAEIYGRTSFDFFMTGGESIPDHEQISLGSSTTRSTSVGGSSSEGQLFNRIRGQDIRLLNEFSISYICDLMVEKKKVKFGMNVTSSEKVDKENRYGDFSIMSVPYPGCEFFREWRDNGYRAEAMTFDWNQGYVDAQLGLPTGLPHPQGIDWSRYRSWDLVKLTQNYLKLLLHCVKSGDGGLLVHCISGWDRTPLFISLMRLSMWADGAIHPNLSPLEILYLTIAYDWFLFGHNLPDRAAKGEEIFFFCFYFLKYMTTEDFCVRRRRKSRTVSHADSDSYVDGILLDPDLQRCSYRGSNTSISSNSSLNSTKSNADNAPIFFTAGSPPDDDGTPLHNGVPVVLSNNNPAPPRASPMSRLSGVPGAPDASHHHRGLPSHVTSSEATHRGAALYATSTTPMAVPSAVRRNLTDVRNSSYGSWQIISGSGSFRGSTSSSPPSSATSDHSAGHAHHGGDNAEPWEESPRKKRLDAVRHTFLTLYTPLLASLGTPDQGGGAGLSGLFENFAEKVGFKAKASYV